jgi:hypothetical protein
MWSPVSSLALGECNAIKSLEFGHLELTWTASWQFRSKLPIRPFLDNFGAAGRPEVIARVTRIKMSKRSPLRVVPSESGCIP